MGLRNRASQAMVDEARWGAFAGISLACRVSLFPSLAALDEPSYSFWMCPGAWLVARASEAGHVGDQA